MPEKKIITGQKVPAARAAHAKALRRQMTPAEGKLWQRLRAGRLDGYHFRRQQVIGRCIVDFYCHAANLVVEVDGGVHLDQDAADRAREQRLVGLGLRVLRFTNQEVNQQMEAVLASILEHCQGGRET